MATYKYYLQDKINKSLFGVDENDKVHIIDFFGQKLEFYDLSVVSNKVTALETLLETDKTDVASVIDTYQEIVEFLTGVDNVDTVLDVIDKQIYEEVTYAELVTLRDNGELVPGKQYRIIDYVTTTSQENTSSDYRRFDIIVTADTNNTLNENARACRSLKGGGYFDLNNLAAWELKYNLDNNSKYSWALNSNIEEAMVVYDGDSYHIYFRWPDYDEDDITAWAYYCGASEGRGEKLKNWSILSIFNPYEDEDGNKTIDLEDMIYTNPNQPPKVGDTLDMSGTPVTITDIGIASAGGKGVIYYMKDDNGNECYYDFKNINYNNKLTFENSSHRTDASINRRQANNMVRAKAYNNIIKECKDELGDWIINECYFSCTDTYRIVGNYVGYDCYDIDANCPINLNFKGGNKGITIDEYSYKNITFCNNVSHIAITPDGLSGNGYIQNIIIYSGVSGTEDRILQIDVDVEDQDYTIEYKHPDAEVRTIALEPGIENLRMYVETFKEDEREDLASDMDYDSWEDWVPDIVDKTGTGDITLSGFKVYESTGETIEINGDTYYLWELNTDYQGGDQSPIATYAATSECNYDYIYGISLENDVNVASGQVYILDEDQEPYATNRGATVIKVERIEE